jgi:hypothetical protein
MTWSCIAVKKPSVSTNKYALVSHLFDASMSTYYWLSSPGCRSCKAFWEHCFLTLLLHSSSVVLAFARNRSRGVYPSSAFITSIWRGHDTHRWTYFVQMIMNSPLTKNIIAKIIILILLLYYHHHNYHHHYYYHHHHLFYAEYLYIYSRDKPCT